MAAPRGNFVFQQGLKDLLDNANTTAWDSESLAIILLVDDPNSAGGTATAAVYTEKAAANLSAFTNFTEYASTAYTGTYDLANGGISLTTVTPTLGTVSSPKVNLPLSGTSQWASLDINTAGTVKDCYGALVILYDSGNSGMDSIPLMFIDTVASGTAFPWNGQGTNVTLTWDSTATIQFAL